MLDPYDDENRPLVGSLVRLSYGVGEHGDPRYKPGVVLAIKGSAVDVKWASVPDIEMWNLSVMEYLSK
jgi:hypothetical protein